MPIMKAPGPYLGFAPSSGNQYTSDANSIISNVAAKDVVDMLNDGCAVVGVKSRQLMLGAAVAALLTITVANVAATNIALTIAAQPDVPRQLVVTFAPGAADVTAGIITLVYKATDGSIQTEAKSLITASGVTISPKTTKGVAVLTSATVSGLVGGSSPTIQIGTNVVVGLPAEQGATGFVVYKETQNNTDVATIGAVDALNGLYTLTTAPNASKLLAVYYNHY